MWRLLFFTKQRPRHQFPLPGRVAVTSSSREGATDISKIRLTNLVSSIDSKNIIADEGSFIERDHRWTSNLKTLYILKKGMTSFKEKEPNHIKKVLLPINIQGNNFL